MKIILISMLLFFMGCGEDQKVEVPIVANNKGQSVPLIMNEKMPNYRKLCVDNNVELFPAQYSICVPVFGVDRCAADQTINQYSLNHEWENILAWTEANLDECVFTNTAEQCFAIYKMQISRMALGCSRVVNWL